MNDAKGTKKEGEWGKEEEEASAFFAWASKNEERNPMSSYVDYSTPYIT